MRVHQQQFAVKPGAALASVGALSAIKQRPANAVTAFHDFSREKCAGPFVEEGPSRALDWETHSSKRK